MTSGSSKASEGPTSGDLIVVRSNGAFHFNATRPDARFTETVVLGPAVVNPE